MGGFLGWLRVQWDRTAAVAAGVIGLLVLVLGWVGVSGTPHIAEQLPYFISGGLIGLFFLGMAVALWLSADLRDEWRELRALRTMLAGTDTDKAGSIGSAR
jgi:peptidoglycan/LPS O-acetylase OafA/YrhL